MDSPHLPTPPVSAPAETDESFSPSATDQINLFGLNQSQLVAFFAELGEKPFRAKQLMQWIYHRGVIDFDEMSDISRKLREKLQQIACLNLPEVVLDQASRDGTHKWLLRMDSGNCIEMVFIPEDDRGTLCVSSQIGCALMCSFCATARQGFNRNLGAHEITTQIWLAKKLLGEYNLDPSDRIVSNVVLMGMGEPLLNFDNVVTSMDIMLDDFGFGLSKRRVTLSTSGVVPALYRLKEVSDVSLAVSLHAAVDPIRDQLVPINKKYPIAVLLEACKNYVAGAPQRKITWEYVMLAGINDSIADAHALAKIVMSIPSKVNLIPYNSFPGVDYQCSAPAVIDRFRNVLVGYGIVVVTRKTRGEDIDAACGQLAGKVQDRSKRAFHFARIAERTEKAEKTEK